MDARLDRALGNPQGLGDVAVGLTFDVVEDERDPQLVRELDAARVWHDPIVTEVAPFSAFYRAEDYHQEYYRQNSGQPYCQVVIAPKVAQFRQRYLAKLKR